MEYKYSLALLSLCYLASLPVVTPKINNCGVYANLTAVLTVDKSDGSPKYTAEVPWFPQMNVYLAMENLREQTDGNFSFVGKFYHIYGWFIDSVNGLAADPAKHQYWGLYMNGKWAGCGVSTLIFPTHGSVAEFRFARNGAFTNGIV